VLLVCGLLLFAGLLASCGKKQAEAPAPAPADHYTDVGGGVHIINEPAQTLPGRVVQHALGSKCQENMRQLRMLIDTSKDETTGSYPSSLASVSGADRLSQCPVSHQPYTYDPATGQVHCTFPGHEKF
jgi:hypothetical protein